VIPHTHVVPSDQYVPVSLSQLQMLTANQTRLIELEERMNRDARERAQKEAEDALQTRNLQEGIAQLRKLKDDEVGAVQAKLVANEDRTRQYAKTSELTRALAEHQLMPGAVDQLRVILGPQLNVNPQGDSYVVQTATMQGVSDFVREILAKPEFSHYMKAQSTGGTGGTTGGHQMAPTAPAQTTPEQVPTVMGVAAIMDVISRRQEEQQLNAGIPAALNPRAAFGLRPVQRVS
jgi:hypothetical protein